MKSDILWFLVGGGFVVTFREASSGFGDRSRCIVEIDVVDAALVFQDLSNEDEGCRDAGRASGTGKAAASGQASGSIGLGGSAAGRADVHGQASGALTIDATASGHAEASNAGDDGGFAFVAAGEWRDYQAAGAWRDYQAAGIWRARAA
ncbi:hypothetical protein ACTTAI_08640 [Rhodobacter capsulatus]|uniref:hypothetical protein n=1 Tax=Rhodobacter capsulatus TaxID=1061 RepID=UPI0040296EC4